MTKDNIKLPPEFGYKLLKTFKLGSFKRKFKPTIIGGENIPKEGSFLVCGNHLHKDDQYNIMMCTSRVLHYMAKEEYFEGKLGWLYRFVGCIKVDRRIHDEESKTIAKEVLNNGRCIGIFPEGTRNIFALRQAEVDRVYDLYYKDITKEEFVSSLNEFIRTSQVHKLEELLSNNKIDMKIFKDNISNVDEYLKSNIGSLITEEEYWDSLMLEFKFGAVSLASKTNSKLLPFVTNGKYTTNKGDLKVIIGKPFEIKDMDLESANKLLRQKMIDLMKNL